MSLLEDPGARWLVLDVLLSVEVTFGWPAIWGAALSRGSS
jgi:hypothetical protein